MTQWKMGHTTTHVQANGFPLTHDYGRLEPNDVSTATHTVNTSENQHRISKTEPVEQIPFGTNLSKNVCLFLGGIPSNADHPSSRLPRLSRGTCGDSDWDSVDFFRWSSCSVHPESCKINWFKRSDFNGGGFNLW